MSTRHIVPPGGRRQGGVARGRPRRAPCLAGAAAEQAPLYRSLQPSASTNHRPPATVMVSRNWERNEKTRRETGSRPVRFSPRTSVNVFHGVVDVELAGGR